MNDDNRSGFTGKARTQNAERRTAKPRRKATGDRREMHRFESEERRSGEDRRKNADQWGKAPDGTQRRKS